MNHEVNFWVSLIITASLVLVFLQFSQAQMADAAISYQVYDGTSCESIPLVSGTIEWLASEKTCKIDGVVSIPNDGIILVEDSLGSFIKLSTTSTSTIHVSGIGGRAIIINNGTMYVGDINLGGSYARVGLSNYGSIFINGGIDVHGGPGVENYGLIRIAPQGNANIEIGGLNEGKIYNQGALFMGGSFVNKGTINNFDHIVVSEPSNFGLINNAGSIEIWTDISNSGTIINCGGSITGTGSVRGNPPSASTCNINPISNSILINEKYVPDDFVITSQVGGDPLVRFVTDDPSQTSVTLRWLDPTGDLAKEKTYSLINHKIQDSAVLDKPGIWTIQALFGDELVASSQVMVSFAVIPESQIGIVALMGSSLAVLGGFIVLRKKQGNSQPHSIGDLGI